MQKYLKESRRKINEISYYHRRINGDSQTLIVLHKAQSRMQDRSKRTQKTHENAPGGFALLPVVSRLILADDLMNTPIHGFYGYRC